MSNFKNSVLEDFEAAAQVAFMADPVSVGHQGLSNFVHRSAIADGANTLLSIYTDPAARAAVLAFAKLFCHVEPGAK